MSDIENRIKSAILLALGDEVEKIKQDICRQAEAEFSNRIRSKVGEVAVRLHDYISMDSMAGNLVIHVKINQSEKK